MGRNRIIYKDSERTEIRRELSKNNHGRRQGPHRAHCLDVPRDVCANNIPRVFGRQRSAIPIIIGQNLPNQIFPPPAKATKIVGGHTRHLAPGLFWGINTSMETWKTANAVHSAIVCILAHVKLPSSNFSNASEAFCGDRLGKATIQYDTYPLSSTSTPLAGSMSHISRHNLSCASLMLELVAYVLLSITFSILIDIGSHQERLNNVGLGLPERYNYAQCVTYIYGYLNTTNYIATILGLVL